MSPFRCIGAVGGSILPSASMYTVPFALTNRMLNVKINILVRSSVNIIPESVLFKDSFLLI